ncbi:Transglycosylase-like protein with SLT domain, partial [Durusdinium trenchii]
DRALARRQDALTANLAGVTAGLEQTRSVLVENGRSIVRLSERLYSAVDGSIAAIEADYMTAAGTDSAIAAFNLELNATFAGLSDDVDAAEANVAAIQSDYMTAAGTDSAIAAFNFNLNATFSALADDVAAAEADIDQAEADIVQNAAASASSDRALARRQDALTANLAGVTAGLEQTRSVLVENGRSIARLSERLYSAVDGSVAAIEADYMTAAGTDSAIAAFNLELNSTFAGLSDDVDAAEASIAVNTATLADHDGRLQAYFNVEANAAGSQAFISLIAIDDGDNTTSNVALGARAISFWNELDSVWVEAAKIEFGDLRLYGSLIAGAGIFQGDSNAKWPVALQSKVYSLADGDSQEYGFTFNEIPEILIDATGLDPLAAGEAYVLGVTNSDEEGFTASLKITTPGTTTAVTENTNATSGLGAGVEHAVAAGDNSKAYNGRYVFYVDVTIPINAKIPAGEPVLYQGNVTIRPYIYDGTNWVYGFATQLDWTAVDVAPTHTSGTVNHVATAVPIVMDYFGDVDFDAVNAVFGAASLGSTYAFGTPTLDDLDRVEYAKQNQSGTRTASPNGEEARFTDLIARARKELAASDHTDFPSWRSEKPAEKCEAWDSYRQALRALIRSLEAGQDPLARDLASRDGLTETERATLMLQRPGGITYRENRFGDLDEAAVVDPALLGEVTRAGPAFVPNWSFRSGDRVGPLREVAANEARWNEPPEDKYWPQPLVETAAGANGVRNPWGLGSRLGVIGGVGQMPTHWDASYGSTTVEIVSELELDGWPVTGFEFTGGSNSDSEFLFFEETTSFAAVQNDWVVFYFVARVSSGDFTGIDRLELQINEYDSGGSSTTNSTVGDHNVDMIAAGLDDELRIFCMIYQVQGATTASVRPTFRQRSAASGASSIDLGLEMGAAQIAQGTEAASPVFPPRGTIAAGSRVADTRAGGLQFERASRAISFAWSGKNGDPAGPAREYLPNAPLSDETGFHRSMRSTTNLIENPGFENYTLGVIGSGGVLPDNMSISTGGLTWEIVKVYREGARKIIRFRLDGTATGNLAVAFSTATEIAAVQNDLYCQHFDIRVIKGELQGTAQCRLFERDSGGTAVATPYEDIPVVDGRWRRGLFKDPISHASTAYAQPYLYVTSQSGDVFDNAEIELALPMAEKLAFPTMPTLPEEGQTGTSSRALGVMKFGLDGWFDREKPFTLIFDFTTIAADPGTANDYIFGIGDQATGANYYYLRQNDSGWNLAVMSNSVFSVGATGSDTYADGARRRMAIRFDPSNFRLVVDGGAELVDNSGPLALAVDLDTLVLGNHAFGEESHMFKDIYLRAADEAALKAALTFAVASEAQTDGEVELVSVGDWITSRAGIYELDLIGSVVTAPAVYDGDPDPETGDQTIVTPPVRDERFHANLRLVGSFSPDIPAEETAMSSKSKKKPAEPAAKRVTDAALDEIEAARSALYDKITAAIDGVDTRDDRTFARSRRNNGLDAVTDWETRWDTAAALAAAADAELKGLRRSVETAEGLVFVKRRPLARPDVLPRMFALSEDYVETLLGGDMSAYLGKTDFDVWPAETAALFNQGDEHAYQLGLAHNFGKASRHRVDEPYESVFTGRAMSDDVPHDAPIPVNGGAIRMLVSLVKDEVSALRKDMRARAEADTEADKRLTRLEGLLEAILKNDEIHTQAIRELEDWKNSVITTDKEANQMRAIIEFFRSPWIYGIAGAAVALAVVAIGGTVTGFVAGGILMKAATFFAAVVFAMVGLQMIRFIRGLSPFDDPIAALINENAIAAAIVRGAIYIGLLFLAGNAFGQEPTPAAWPQSAPAPIERVVVSPGAPAVAGRFSPCAPYLEAAEEAVELYWPAGLSYPRAYLAQLYQESLCDPAAVSPVGARGLAQFMPATWREAQARLGYQTSLTPHDDIAIEAGAWYMARTMSIWSRRERPMLEIWRLGLASYNAGGGNIIAAQSACNGVRDWHEIELCLPQITGHHAAETRSY